VRHVVVIDPGTRAPELDCFNRIARAAPCPVTYHLPALYGTDSLQRASDGVLGIVILGSGASVHDDLDWQHALDDWLLPYVARDTPTLGLCYGHQHLADRLGGAVGFVHDDQHKERGVRTIQLDPDRLWGAALQGPMIVSHREVVTALRTGFVEVGRREGIANDAFAHPIRPIWGFQPHPEATTAFTTGNGIVFDGVPSDLGFGNTLVDAFVAWAAEHKG